MKVIHLFRDVPNMRNAVNRADTVRFAFLRDRSQQRFQTTQMIKKKKKA